MLELNLKAKPYNWYEDILGKALYDKIDFTTLVGSRHICPELATDTTDWDILAYVHKESDWNDVIYRLNSGQLEGWKRDADSYSEDDVFLSYRKDKVNLLLSGSAEFVNSFIRAANLCKTLHITDKPTRVKIHEELQKPVFDVFRHVRMKKGKSFTYSLGTPLTGEDIWSIVNDLSNHSPVTS